MDLVVVQPRHFNPQFKIINTKVDEYQYKS